MKIIYFNTLYAPNIGGGAEVTLQQQVEALQSNGNDVLVICLGPEKGVVHDTVNGVQVVRVGLPNMYLPLVGEVRPPLSQRLLWHWRDQDNEQITKQLLQVVDEFAPDVASCHNLAGLSVAVWRLLRMRSVPIVQVLHDQYLLCPKTTMVREGKVCVTQCMDCRFLRRHHARKSNSVDAVVGVSNYIVDKMLTAGYFGRATRSVINNVRRAAMFSDADVARPLRADQLTFGFIGGVTPIKGIERLLQAFIGASLDGASRLVIAGRGEDAYISRLKAAYADSRIEWLGYAKPSEFFQKIDVLVVPSIWHDTYPGVVFEAFGFGVPVLGSDRGGIPEMVKDGINGTLFDPEAPGVLEESLRRLTLDFSAVTVLSQGAFANALQYQDIAAWVNSYENIYKATIARRSFVNREAVK